MSKACKTLKMISQTCVDESTYLFHVFPIFFIGILLAPFRDYSIAPLSLEMTPVQLQVEDLIVTAEGIVESMNLSGASAL